MFTVNIHIVSFIGLPRKWWVKRAMGQIRSLYVQQQAILTPTQNIKMSGFTIFYFGKFKPSEESLVDT
jgi:hypothetical protein